MDFLYTAYVLKEKKIMEDYAVWLYQLMASVLKNRTHIQTVEYVVRHLEYIRQAVEKTVSEDKISELQQLLVCAQNSIRAQVADEEEAEETGIDYTAPVSEYENEIGEYMEALFSKDMRKALQLVQKFAERGISAATIYVDILAESMRRVGELWHTAKISVDAEHYCTSVTQMAMAQMYPVLFLRRERIGQFSVPVREQSFMRSEHEWLQIFLKMMAGMVFFLGQQYRRMPCWKLFVRINRIWSHFPLPCRSIFLHVRNW